MVPTVTFAPPSVTVDGVAPTFVEAEGMTEAHICLAANASREVKVSYLSFDNATVGNTSTGTLNAGSQR